jgi:SM-20-related protein
MAAEALNPGADRSDAALVRRLASALAGRGVAVTARLLAAPLLQALRDDCVAAHVVGALQPAAIGRGAAALQAPTLRGDSTLWLAADPRHPVRGALLQRLQWLQQRLNRRLQLGLEQVEAHYAAYPPGAAYLRHLDRFRDDDARVLSFTCYLNPDWQPDDGGALRLYLADGPRDILPRLGTCTLFLSASIEHEVLPARRTRYSIAGWFLRGGRNRS